MSGRLKLKTENLDWVAASDETVILDTVREHYLATNPAGTLLWNALSEGTTRDELVTILKDSYEIEDEQAQQDVDAYLDQVRELGLLEEE